MVRAAGRSDTIHPHRIHLDSRNHLPNPEDNLIVEESLAIPQLIKFGAIKRLRAGQAVVTLDTAGLAVGVLPVELQELHAERSAFPVQKLFGVEICPNDQRAIPAPFARLSTPRTGGRSYRPTRDLQGGARSLPANEADGQPSRYQAVDSRPLGYR